MSSTLPLLAPWRRLVVVVVINFFALLPFSSPMGALLVVSSTLPLLTWWRRLVVVIIVVLLIYAGGLEVFVDFAVY